MERGIEPPQDSATVEDTHHVRTSTTEQEIDRSQVRATGGDTDPPDFTDGSMELTMEDMDVAEDLDSELQAFVRLSRLGLFEEASRWFDECLNFHEHKFPVLVERADMLLRAELYPEAIKLLTEWLATIEERPDSLVVPEGTSRADISQLLTSMRTLAEVQSGELTGYDALPRAKEHWEYLKASVDDKLSDAQVHLLEVYLDLVAHFAIFLPTEDTDMYTNPPWTPEGTPDWSGFHDWYASLRDQGYHWEAYSIQRILLPHVHSEDEMKIYMRQNQSQLSSLADSIGNGEFDESLVLTELMNCNIACEYFTSPYRAHPGRALLAEAYLKASRFLKATLSYNSTLDIIEDGLPLQQVEKLEEDVETAKTRESSLAATKINETALKVNELRLQPHPGGRTRIGLTQ